MFDATTLLSPLARSGTPPYFHKNPPHITFDFDQGTPDPRQFPVADLARLAELVLHRDGPEAGDYMSPRYGYGDLAMGWSPLREQIAALIGERDGRTPEHDGVIVTNGSVQAVALAANAFPSNPSARYSVVGRGARSPSARCRSSGTSTSCAPTRESRRTPPPGSSPNSNGAT